MCHLASQTLSPWKDSSRPHSPTRSTLSLAFLLSSHRWCGGAWTESGRWRGGKELAAADWEAILSSLHRLSPSRAVAPRARRSRPAARRLPGASLSHWWCSRGGGIASGGSGEQQYKGSPSWLCLLFPLPCPALVPLLKTLAATVGSGGTFPALWRPATVALARRWRVQGGRPPPAATW